MSIQTCTAYRVGELVFSTIADAQKKELGDILKSPVTEGVDEDGLSKLHNFNRILDAIIDNTDEVVAILTCSPKKKAAPRKPRSDIGKKRKVKEEPA